MLLQTLVPAYRADRNVLAELLDVGAAPVASGLPNATPAAVGKLTVTIANMKASS